MLVISFSKALSSQSLFSNMMLNIQILLATHVQNNVSNVILIIWPSDRHVWGFSF